MDIKEIYKKGFLDGLEADAYITDGVYYVVRNHTPLKITKQFVEQTWNYDPPELESPDQDSLDGA